MSNVPPTIAGRRQWIVGGLALAILLLSALRFDGPTRGYWDTYIAVPAMFMTGQEVALQRIDGSPRYEYALEGRIPDDTFDLTPGSYGIASKDQRIGTAILFGAPFAALNLAAFRWVYALSWALMFLFAFLALQRLVGGFRAPLAASLLLVLNPFSLYLDRLNGNQLGLFVLVFLWFLMTAQRPRWWLIGLVYGLLGGIRNEAIILGPMFMAFMARDAGHWRPFAAKLGAFTAAAFAGILPVLLWNQLAYGQMIIHPSQVAHLEGYRPTFEHSLLGMSFQFNGLLNWPFHDHMVRTPHFAFPTFIHWPLVTIKSLGVVLSAVALIGAALIWKRRRFEAAALFYWYLIVALLFAFQENWEELKQTFMALHLFPIAAFLAVGLAWLGRRLSDWRRWGLTGGLATALLLAVLSARLVDAPADERWFVRFPHADVNRSGLDGLPRELRKDWQFFHTRETAEEIAEERRLMTTPSPLPALYRPVHVPSRGALARIVREPFETQHETLAIWSYIYE